MNFRDWVRELILFILMCLIKFINRMSLIFHPIIRLIKVTFSFSKPISLVIVIGSLYILFWHMPVPILPDPYVTVSRILSIFEIQLNETLFVDLIKRGRRLILYVMPLTLTFFYFSYREQKSLAISNNGFWNSKMLIFIGSSIFTIAFGFHLGAVWNNIEPLSKSLVMQSDRAWWWIIFFVSSLISGITVIMEQMNSLNLNYQLHRSINKVKTHLNASFMAAGKKHLAETFEALCSITDGVYQLLFLAIEKNMVRDYKDNIEKWMDAVSVISEDPDVYYPFGNTKRKPYIIDIKKDFKEFRMFYRTILKNQITLISKNIQNNRVEDAKDAIQMLKDLKLTPDDLKEEYYISLHELILLAFKQDFIDLILDEFINILKTEDNKEFGLTLSIYNRLLLYSVEENDVKLLSKIIYLMTQTQLVSGGKIINEEEKAAVRIPPPTLRPIKKKTVDPMEAKVYSIFLVTIKCIELSQYAQVGFLIKFLVTNFEGSLLRKVFGQVKTNLINNGSHLNPFYDTQSSLGVEIAPTKQTAAYCFEKFSLLLYGQQKYVVENKVFLDRTVQVTPLIQIDRIMRKLSYRQYLYQKILTAKDKYGLLFLNQIFFEKLEENIKQRKP